MLLQSGVDRAAARAKVESASIQKRVLEPEELTPVALLLASEDGTVRKHVWLIINAIPNAPIDSAARNRSQL